MNGLQVGYDVTPLGGRRTGVGNYAHAVLRAMLQAPGDATFAALSSGRHRPDLGDLPGMMRHRHIALPTRAMYKVWETFGAPRADRLLGGVDVFHATNYFLPPVASARRVLSIYDLAFLKHPEWCSPRIVGPFSRNVRRFAQQADAIIACSEATRHDIVQLLDVPSERVHVVYGAVDEDFAPLPRAEAKAMVAKHLGIQQPYVLYLGTLEPRKNIEGLLRAFAHAAKDIPHNLVLAGGMGWGMEHLEATIARAGLQSRVKLTGYLENPQLVPALYSAADLFFFPSHYEGFGLPVLEAMACGCPVLTSYNSSLPEVGGKAAEYVDPAHPAVMAETLARLLHNAAKREQMRAAGLVQAAAFSWRDAAERTLKVYRSVAACAS